MLRKINAVLSLLCTILILDHALFNAVWMLSQGGVTKTVNSLSFVLYALMLVHAVISIILAVLGHKGAEKRKCNDYPKLNIPTTIQRVSGILLIVFTTLHIAGTIGILQPPPLVHAILPPLFFTLALAHVAVSTSKAFITLGIGNAKFIKIADIAVKALCAVTLITAVIGFYIHLC